MNNLTTHERRKLVYVNLLNSASLEQVGIAFQMSSEEVQKDFDFVSLKIKSYYFERAMPFVSCDTIPNAIMNKVELIKVLDKLNLETLPAYSKITTQPVESMI